MTMAHATELDPDQATIEAIRRGDRAAFQAFARAQGRLVRGVIFGVLGDADRVEDVAQQVWQSVWTRIENLRNVAQWRSWLYRLARNAAVDAGREQTRRNRLAKQAAAAPPAAGPRTPEREAIGQEQHRDVMNAIAGLPAIYREPFVLRHLHDWSYPQIAETMGMPPATVETRLVRARQLLREALTGKL